jgi:uncharacterized protein (TIGR02145 family)
MTGYTTPVFTKALQFSQLLVNLIEPTAPYILYWDATTGTMQLGKWSNQITAANYKTTMLVFKFGGVVGMDLNGTTFALSNIKFNPTVDVSITGWGVIETNGEANMVPGFTAADYTAGIRNVSATTYHKIANVKEGKGDPCKLVGLTIEQIKAGVIDNGQWRLPTNIENQSFVGSSANQSAGSAYYTYTANAADSTNPAVCTFSAGTANGAQLPAAGYRFRNSGGISNLGDRGFYWSSEPYSGSGGYSLVLHDTTVFPSNADTYHRYGMAMSVRCVPQ